ncbi:MAG: sugar ABC transporter ATP-binding protein [Chitinophagales bacterium]
MTTPEPGTLGSAPFLEMRGITKLFPGVRALTRVNLSVARGAVTALVGENGAGKSTLIKILGGNYAPDEGEITVDGATVAVSSPAIARSLGISIIHQELNLVKDMSVAENVYLYNLPTGRFGWLDRRRLASDTRATLARLGCEFDPWRPVRQLTLAQQQLVEIARALTLKARLIVMDEPTAALNEAETDRLFDIIGALRAQGTAVIYISHRLEEVFRLADVIVVLRDGENAGCLTRAEATVENVIRLMVGREVTERFPKREVPFGEPLLSVDSLSSPGALSGISFTLRRGEILGVGGLMGAGQYALARSLFGLLPLSSGRIAVGGRPVRLSSPRAAIQAGLGLLPESRKEEGLVLPASVGANLELASLPRLAGAFGWLDRRKEAALVGAQCQSLAIKASGPGQPVRNLSGGNQQKVVLGKWLATNPEIIVMCEPTRGIDVRAKAEIYRLIGELVAAGKGIILVSSDLPELLALSDRVLVMNEGRVAGILSRADATPERVMLLATGGNVDAQR